MNTTLNPDWILIANTTRARVLQQQRGGVMEVLESFVHPAGRGQATPPLLDARQKEYTRFAQELAQYLEAEARMGHFSALVILAPLPFLDELRGTLGKFTARLLVGTVERDLTSWGIAELARQVSRELAEVAH
ncbi:MAG: host attachment protein [Ramlibacter sp.]|nr:host attachment protein [Ramlibacter sp.]